MEKDNVTLGEPKPSSLFPCNMTIKDCREAIKGVPGFKELYKDGYSVFSYSFCFRDTFPDPNKAKDEREAFLFKVRRECRGITFDTTTGKLISRKFHKFFNVGELEETSEVKINLSEPHVILEKLDGCLFSPLIHKNVLRFGSKNGITELSIEMEQRFLQKSKIDYATFSNIWVQKGYTPIFEYMARHTKIVIEYEHDQLVLIALRHNETGCYVPYDKMVELVTPYNIPYVKAADPSLTKDCKTIADLVTKVKGLQEVEGFVLWFDNGNLYKVKTDWYCSKAKGEDRGSGLKEEKELWTVILNQSLDDYMHNLTMEERDKVDDFGKKLWEALQKSTDLIVATIQEAKSRNLSTKDFAIQVNKVAQQNPKTIQSHKAIYLTVWRSPPETEPLDLVVKYVLGFCKKREQFDEIRSAFAPNIKFA